LATSWIIKPLKEMRRRLKDVAAKMRPRKTRGKKMIGQEAGAPAV